MLLSQIKMLPFSLQPNYETSKKNCAYVNLVLYCYLCYNYLDSCRILDILDGAIKNTTWDKTDKKAHTLKWIFRFRDGFMMKSNWIS